jgi:hypothetical protein
MLEEHASRILPLPGVKQRARDGINFKQLLILQEQGRTLAKLLDVATGHFERHSLYNQLRQVNHALGLSTPPLALDAERSIDSRLASLQMNSSLGKMDDVVSVRKSLHAEIGSKACRKKGRFILQAWRGTTARDLRSAKRRGMVISV